MREIEDGWVREDGATFVRHYPGFYNPNERYAAYRAVKPVAGRNPWTLDNRRIGFFPTLAEALAAAEAA